MGFFLYILHNKVFPKKTFKFGLTRNIKARKWHTCYTTAFVESWCYKKYYELDGEIDDSLLFEIEAAIKKSIKKYNTHEADKKMINNIGKEMYCNITLKQLSNYIECCLEEYKSNYDIDYNIHVEDILERPKKEEIRKSEKTDTQRVIDFEQFSFDKENNLDEICSKNKNGEKLTKDMLNIVDSVKWYYNLNKFRAEADKKYRCAFCNHIIKCIYVMSTHNDKYNIYSGIECTKRNNIIFLDDERNSIANDSCRKINIDKTYLFQLDKEIRNIDTDINSIFYSFVNNLEDDNGVINIMTIENILAINDKEHDPLYVKTHPLVGATCLYAKIYDSNNSYIDYESALTILDNINHTYNTYYSIDAIVYFLTTRDIPHFGYNEDNKTFLLNNAKKAEEYILQYFAKFKINNKSYGDMDELAEFIEIYSKNNDVFLSLEEITEALGSYYAGYRDDPSDETFEEIIDYLNEGDEFQMKEDAYKAFLSVQNNTHSIITGGPGCGKTKLCKSIYEMFKNHKTIFIAPTGKAVSRIIQACKTDDAYTIDMFFIKNDRKDIPSSEVYLFIIDEISMIDTFKLGKLLKYLEPFSRSKFLWVGDIDQLPPVGFGMPFKSILSSNNCIVKCTELKYAFRNKNIGKLRKRIKSSNKLPELRNDIIMKPETDHIFRKYYDRKYQIITFTHKNCKRINDELFPGDIFKEGTPIMFKKNKYDDECKYIYNNGMRAKMAESGFETMTKQDKIIGYRISIYKMEKESELQYSDKIVSIVISGTSDVIKAAAITIHSVQGSEYKNVLIYHSSGDFDESLLYVACSRAEEKTILIHKKGSYESNITRKSIPYSFIDYKPLSNSIVVHSKYDATRNTQSALKKAGFKYNKPKNIWVCNRTMTPEIMDYIQSNKYCTLIT